ncbi:ubiquitin-conjugating enzyme/RWD-like protein [Gilbertella persicaria]|uniref:ubiquitin-conjugating enzyme/RWD-like protein n=1 Tax=Gilbertella persicaria TaxID=101096 RepID=UPI00221E949E|nr:ubiquitin-conjugating enzyme/RWD-like protein [Gilbertella persicaria]KAI8076404.1 ubiquitin-conjugating enzyme/RWD-like protein [Gilbertella persicaria]
MSINYNLKNPGIKRIMQEAKELAKESNYDYDAHPLEDNIFEWHFTVLGPKDTDFDGGRYHGRILLPNEYPFKPPEIIFLTPNGRFELNTKICLSITGFHPEFWQPAWGSMYCSLFISLYLLFVIRTVLLDVIGFFPTEAKGAVGVLDYTKEERYYCIRSIGWICPICEVNTIDALSDNLPEETRKEELPEFTMTYKSTKENDKEAESDVKENPASENETAPMIDKHINLDQVENSSSIQYVQVVHCCPHQCFHVTFFYVRKSA